MPKARIGLSVPIFGSEDLAVQSEIHAVPKLLDGAAFPANQINDAFFETFSRSYDDTSKVAHAGFAYDFVRMLVAILESDADAALDAQKLRRAFASIPIKEGPLATPERILSKEGAVTFSYPIVMRTLVNGKPRTAFRP